MKSMKRAALVCLLISTLTMGISFLSAEDHGEICADLVQEYQECLELDCREIDKEAIRL